MTNKSKVQISNDQNLEAKIQESEVRIHKEQTTEDAGN